MHSATALRHSFRTHTEGDDDEDDDDRDGWNTWNGSSVSRPSRPKLSSCVLASRSRDPALPSVSRFFSADARQILRKVLPPTTMSDEGFDLCECMWNYMSVQHLLSILRQSQDLCSDTECFSVSRTPGSQTNVREPSDFLFTCLIIGFIVLLYAFRPRSLRQSTRNVIKNSNEPGSHGDDPPSPPTMN